MEVERIWVPYNFDRHFFTFISIPYVIKQTRKYDLIHTTWYNGAVPGFIGAKLRGKPIVFTALEVLGKRWELITPSLLASYFFRSIEKIVALLPYDKYVAISQNTYNESVKLGTDPKRALVIHCGIDELFCPEYNRPDIQFRSRLGISSSDFLYMYYGRSGITKGVDYLIKAAPTIQKEIPNAHLVMILGKEPHRRYERLLTLISEVGKIINVHVIDPVPDRKQLASYLKVANCIVVPSLSEGFGLTVAESCALGIPVVASNVGSIPEVISGKYILVEPGSPESIAKGVRKAYEGKFDELISPKRFDWKEMILKYEELYKSQLSDSGDYPQNGEGIESSARKW